MNIFLRLFAGLIDALQFLFLAAFIVLQALTPVGGAAAGGVTGAVVCWNLSTGFFEGIVSAAKCAAGGGLAGLALSTFATPLGMAIDVVISVSLGGALIIGLASRGMFYPDLILKNMVGEVLPVFAFLPFWSYLVHASIKRHKQGAPGGVFSAAMGFAFGAQGGQGIANATSLALGEQRGQEIARPRRFADIMPPPQAEEPEPQYAKTA